MLISKQVFDELHEKGVDVKWFKESTYQEYVSNTKREIVERDKKSGYNSDGNDAWVEKRARDICSPYDHKELYVTWRKGKRESVMRVPVKSKRLTVEEVVAFCAKKDKAYKGDRGRFVEKMTSILRLEKISAVAYPTTYGIGFWILWSRPEDEIAAVKRVLDREGVQYAEEYSDARWVWRIKLSKAERNIKQLNNIIN